MGNPCKAFLSHNSTDKPAVLEIGQRLEAEGISCWIDVWRLVPGERWIEAVQEALNRCEVIVVFFGPGGIGPWHQEEMDVAIQRRIGIRERRVRLVPVLLPGGRRLGESQLPPFLQGTMWVEFRHSIAEEDAFQRLKCGILGQAPGPLGKPGRLDGICPYVGLKAFTHADAPLFFGREALLEQVVSRQREHFGTVRERKFIALMGASGSGKSSFASACLLPAMQERGALPGSTDWIFVRMRPGSRPWESLQVALASHSALAARLETVNSLVRSPEQEAHRLHLLARLAMHDGPPSQRLVLFVDQFEEFFALHDPRNSNAESEPVRRRFLDNLLYPAAMPESRVLVILTMRTDFFGPCAACPGLGVAVSENQVLVGPLSSSELRLAIEEPARLGGCELEPALLNRLLEDMEQQPGALPFLQHALFKLWEAREGRWLTAAAYQRMGSLKGALNAHSEAFYTGLSPADQALLRTVLLDLIQLGEGAADTKRRRLLDHIGDGNTPRLHPFITEVANAHLVITDKAAGGVQVEVSHEALISGWNRLRSWIDESREEKRQKERIESAANAWALAEPTRRNDFLWRGAQLESVEFALRDSTLPLHETANAFLEACREGRRREVTEEQQNLERERQTAERIQEAETARARAEAEMATERARYFEKRRENELSRIYGILGTAVTAFTLLALYRKTQPGLATGGLSRVPYSVVVLGACPLLALGSILLLKICRWYSKTEASAHYGFMSLPPVFGFSLSGNQASLRVIAFSLFVVFPWLTSLGLLYETIQRGARGEDHTILNFWRVFAFPAGFLGGKAWRWNHADNVSFFPGMQPLFYVLVVGFAGFLLFRSLIQMMRREPARAAVVDGAE